METIIFVISHTIIHNKNTGRRNSRKLICSIFGGLDETSPIKLWQLNTWSSVEGFLGGLRGKALLEEGHHFEASEDLCHSKLALFISCVWLEI